MARPGLDDDRRLARIRADIADQQSELDGEAATLADEILAELDRPRGPRRSRLNRLLARFRELIDRGEVFADSTFTAVEQWADPGLDRVYAAGARVAGVAAFGAGAAFAVAAHRALLLDPLGRAVRSVERGGPAALRRLGGLLAEAEGSPSSSLRRIGRQVRRQLEQRAVAVTYRNGARHPFGGYVDMLVDTRTALTYNQGTLDAARQRGVDVFEITDGPNCGLASHNDPTRANGLIVVGSIASAYPIAHPHCVRQFFPRDDLADRFEVV